MRLRQSRRDRRRGSAPVEVIAVAAVLVPILAALMILALRAAGLFHHLVESTVCGPLM